MFYSDFFITTLFCLACITTTTTTTIIIGIGTGSNGIVISPSLHFFCSCSNDSIGCDNEYTFVAISNAATIMNTTTINQTTFVISCYIYNCTTTTTTTTIIIATNYYIIFVVVPFVFVL